MSSRRKINLLITCVGGELVPQLLILMRKSEIFNINIIGVDSRKDAVGKYFCDYFYQVPVGTKEKQYIAMISELISKHKIQIIIPASDEESITLSKNKKKIRELNCTVVVDDYEKIKILNNKLETYKFLKKKQFPVPFWEEVNSYHRLENIINKCNEKYLNLVLKSTNQRGSRSIYFIDKEKKISDFLNNKVTLKMLIEDFKQNEKLFPLIIMEEYVKPVYDIDILTWKGKLLKTVQRKRIHSDFPNRGHKVVKIDAINEYCENLVSHLDVSWLYDCDIMFCNNKKPCLLEINPRQSGSLAISMMSGINFIDDIINLSLGKKVSKVKKFKERTFIPYKMLKIRSTDV